ncbi:hypothetical protein KY330_00570 [Candidatus Woesearchaeota archaeon]|nr:hypothetical protein [Candidatus Woesearchaeota archaeon]
MTRRDHNLFSLKVFLSYAIAFSIGFWISTLVTPFINTNNQLVIYIITGLFLELSAKTCQMFLYNKPRIIIDKGFLLWVFIHSNLAYAIVYLVQKINISTKYLFIISVGLGITVITNLIWRVMYSRKGFHSPNFNLSLFELVKIPFALFTIFMTLTSIYLTFTSFLFGVFIPPIFCIAIAGSLIKYFDRDANGKKFLWDTLALAGVLLLLVVLFFYQMFAPIFRTLSVIK